MHNAPVERRQGWTLEDVSTLTELVTQRVEPTVIALKMKRSEDDVRAKAAEIGRALRVASQTPPQADRRPM